MPIKLFMDSAKKEELLEAYQSKKVSGFTTNPTLMKQAGVNDYQAFACELISLIPDMPISFEVFSDELDAMEKEAKKIHSWGGDTYIKLPVSNTKGVLITPLMRILSDAGIPLNITAVFTLDQVKAILKALNKNIKAIISIFAGRIANAGIDPMPIMQKAADLLKEYPHWELLWASPREALNYKQAETCGCDIITMTPSLIQATKNFGKDLDEYSLDTVKMFYKDAELAGYSL